MESLLSFSEVFERRARRTTTGYGKHQQHRDSDFVKADGPSCDTTIRPMEAPQPGSIVPAGCGMLYASVAVQGVIIAELLPDHAVKAESR